LVSRCICVVFILPFLLFMLFFFAINTFLPCLPWISNRCFINLYPLFSSVPPVAHLLLLLADVSTDGACGQSDVTVWKWWSLPFHANVTSRVYPLPEAAIDKPWRHNVSWSRHEPVNKWTQHIGQHKNITRTLPRVIRSVDRPYSVLLCVCLCVRVSAYPEHPVDRREGVHREYCYSAGHLCKVMSLRQRPMTGHMVTRPQI
jgi:hypothetical protein